MNDADTLKRMMKKVEDRQRAMLDKAESEERDLTPLEEREYQGLERQWEDLRNEWEGTPLHEPIKPDPNEDELEQRYTVSEKAKGNINMTEMTAFQKYLTEGRGALTNNEYRDFEQRALKMDSSPSGGYLVAPEQFTSNILKKLDDALPVRSRATKIPVNSAHSLGVPVLENDPGNENLSFTAEIAEADIDNDMSFQKRELYPHPLARLIKVSKTLIRRSAIDIESFVSDRLVYVLSTCLENAYLNGSGSNEPLGLFVASSDGIDTDRDVSTGNTTTSIKADGLIEAQGSLKPQYRRGATWIFSRNAIKQIRKLKDGAGDYLWTQGLQGSPDTILGHRFLISEYCPDVFSSGQYVGILGDLSFLWIAIALDIQIQVLNERFATRNEVGILARLEEDASAVISEAFARVKLA